MEFRAPITRLAISIAIATAIAVFTAVAFAHPPANPAGDDVPLTGGDAQQRGVIPQNYEPIQTGIYKDDVVMPPAPEATPEPTSSANNAPPIIDGVGRGHDAKYHGITPGEAAFNRTADTSVMDPLNWSVTVYKHRHEMVVSYKGLWFGTYRAVFGRNLDPSAKNFEGDRRTPEGVYMIVAKHPSRRWRYFMTLNYPNLVDRIRYDELRDSDELPVDVGVGGRIGIHGTDVPVLNQGNVNWTTGCISIDNDIVTRLYRILPTGTLVIIKP